MSGTLQRAQKHRTAQEELPHLPAPPIPILSPREALLKSLMSDGRHRYSRYNGLPLRYAGGKSLAVGYVIEKLPPRVKKLVSPFFGGGSVEIACAKELGLSVQGYDLFDILTNYWRVQLRARFKLAERIGRWKPNKKTYEQVKKRLKAHWNGTKLITDPVELAAHYWFNHNLSYGPGFLGWMSKIYEEQNRFERLLAKVENFRCPGLRVQQGSFEKIIPKHRGDFLYCDPPYYLDGNRIENGTNHHVRNRMFRGIYPQRNFPVHHNKFDHGTLRKLLHTHKGGFILSYNMCDCDTIREWYKDYRKIVEVSWQYTLGSKERLVSAKTA